MNLILAEKNYVISHWNKKWQSKYAVNSSVTKTLQCIMATKFKGNKERWDEERNEIERTHLRHK